MEERVAEGEYFDPHEFNVSSRVWKRTNEGNKVAYFTLTGVKEDILGCWNTLGFLKMTKKKYVRQKSMAWMFHINEA